MPLRDQPYLPLYVQDFMTDEKLAECSAAATGVYIRIMCLMHKNETYGKILLKQKHKQKHKQTDNQILNFAKVVVKNLPYDLDIVYKALCELVEENVLYIDGDCLVQKRMVKDNEISEKRAIAGKNGGTKTQLKTKDFAKAKSEANTEIENENESEGENGFVNDSFGKSENLLNSDLIIPTVCRNWYAKFPTYTKDQQEDFHAVGKMLGFMMRQHSITDVTDPEAKEKIIATIDAIAEEVAKEAFWTNKPLKSIANNIQEFYNRIKNPIQNGKTNQPNNTRVDLQTAINKRFGSGQ